MVFFSRSDLPLISDSGKILKKAQKEFIMVGET